MSFESYWIAILFYENIKPDKFVKSET